MAIIIKPPSRFMQYHDVKDMVFLAGSIEMGKADDWQKYVENKLLQYDMVILNPRRDDWDSSWKQEIGNDQFREQVEWELKALTKCDVIMLYFSPETKSPISLLELGLFAQTGKLIVCCPEGFWKKGNVDIVCKKYNILQCDTLDELIHAAINGCGQYVVESIRDFEKKYLPKPYKARLEGKLKEWFCRNCGEHQESIEKPTYCSCWNPWFVIFKESNANEM